jgi:aerobic-type carbon monoxide dehydrogenase small subunit (CoxS/CutS family)
MRIAFMLNRQAYEREVEGHRTLLHFIREDLGLTGAKEGCGAGECGACTILMDGEAVNACMVLAAEADGRVLETIEGEAKGGRLTAIQESFNRHHAVQCGFCTPGMILSVRDLLARNPTPTVDEIREGIEGNFCRCTGYQQIIEAVLDVSGQPAGKGGLIRV